MPPMEFPKVTQAEVDARDREQAMGFLKALTVTGGVTALNYRFNAPGGKLVQEPLKFFLTGIKATPGPGGRATIQFPKASVVTALFPSPIGYVPPEFYNLHPEVVKRTFAPFSPGSKPLGFSVSDERNRLFEASQIVESIAKRAAPGSIRDASGGADRYSIPPGLIPVTTAELEWLKTLPAGLTPYQQITSRLEARRDDLADVWAQNAEARYLEQLTGEERRKYFAKLKAANDPLTGPVGKGSSQPALFRPTNALALAIQASAKWLRKELLSERADP